MRNTIDCTKLQVSPRIIADAEGTVGNINLTSVWSALIKEAGKCEAYASDILIDICPMIQAFNDGVTNDFTYFFGFRDCGVDHQKFIECRQDLREYRAVWRMKTVVCPSEYGGKDKVAVYLQECFN